MKKIIYSKNAPKPIGPYSQAVLVDNTLYCSGQIPINSTTGELEDGDIKAQTQVVCDNIKVVLESAKMNFDNVVKTTCYLANMDDFKMFNSVYEKYFISCPARSCVAVKTLPKNSLVEIEIIATMSI